MTWNFEGSVWGVRREMVLAKRHTGETVWLDFDKGLPAFYVALNSTFLFTRYL